jgi:hypothetical protein
MAIPGMPKQLVADFTNVKDQSGYSQTHQRPGDYRGKIKSVEYGVSQQNKTPMLTYALQDAKRPSATYRYNCTLTEKSLWKLRNLLVAAGVNVPKKKLNIAGIAEKIVGREIGMTLDDDEYEGKIRSQVVGVFPADELPQDANDDEETVDQDDTDEDSPAADDDTEDGEEDLEELDLDDM